MKSDLFARTLLIIIVTLLALNIILPLLTNPATSYAAKNIEYKVIFFGDELQEAGGRITKDAEPIEKKFIEYGKEGWEYTGQITFMGGTLFLIFKR
jgi:hypothetical protein